MSQLKHVHWRDKEPQERVRTRRSRRSHSPDPDVEDLHEARAVKQPDHMGPCMLPDAKPSEFPSLESMAKTPMPEGRHGVGRLLEERMSGNSKSARDSCKRMDDMYNRLMFQENMDKEEKKWYADLRERWGSCVGPCKIEFTKVFPSLRQAIIESIREELAGVFHRDYYPVECLLGMTQKTLQDIIQHDARDDSINEYALKHKIADADKAVDPDTPPPMAVIHAILYLKQEHLPASLLGEWQFPLPIPETPPSPEIEQRIPNLETSYPYNPNKAKYLPAPLLPLDICLENLSYGMVYNSGAALNYTEEVISSFEEKDFEASGSHSKKAGNLVQNRNHPKSKTPISKPQPISVNRSSNSKRIHPLVSAALSRPPLLPPSFRDAPGNSNSRQLNESNNAKCTSSPSLSHNRPGAFGQTPRKLRDGVSSSRPNVDKS